MHLQAADIQMNISREETLALMRRYNVGYRLSIVPMSAPSTRCRVSIWIPSRAKAYEALDACRGNPAIFSATLSWHQADKSWVEAFVASGD